MAAMGMLDYCLNSEDLEADKLIETFCRLQANADAVKALIKEKVMRFRDDLDQQYQLVLTGMQCVSGVTSSATVLVDRRAERLGECQRHIPRP
jgi:hypothetical protein